MCVFENHIYIWLYCLHIPEKNVCHCIPNILLRVGSRFGFITTGRLVGQGVPSSHQHLPLFSLSHLRWTDFLLQCTKPSPPLTLHCTLAHYIKHCCDCQGSLEIHTRSRWTERRVLHCRPGSLSMIWLDIWLVLGGKGHQTSQCPLSLWLALQNESRFSNTQKIEF